MTLKKARFILPLLLLTACATTPKVEVTPVEIKPVTQIKSDPFDAESVANMGDLYFKSESYTEALTEYSKLLAYDPNSVRAGLGAGQTFLALGQYENANAIFGSDKFDWPEDQKDQVEIGKILAGIFSDQYDNPETALHDGMMIDPDDPRLWNAKGHLHDKKGEWMEALSCYVTALETGKGRSGTINNMGMSLLLQGRFDEALPKFEQAVDLSPRTDLYDNNRRMSQILSGDLIRALEDIEDNRASDILNDAGYVAMQRDRRGLAGLLFQKAIEISPVFHAKASANLKTLQTPEQLP